MNPYETIKEEILLGKLKPGSLFNEKEYAERLGTSRTPIREAVLKLAGEGYINILPRKGTIISSISYSDILSLYEYRSILEPNLFCLFKEEPSQDWIDKWKTKFSKPHPEATLSNEDEDMAFHVELASFTHNEYLVQQEKMVMEKCLRVRVLSNMHSKKRYEESLAEHISILEALEAKDYKAASTMLKKHLKNTLKGISFVGE